MKTRTWLLWLRVAGIACGLLAARCTPSTSPSTALDAAVAIEFRDHGKVIRRVPLAELSRLAAPLAVSVFEPHESAPVVYTAIPTEALFQTVFGEAWEHAEDVLLTCKDGYQPVVPRTKFREHVAYLALARPDRDAFRLHNRLHNEHVDLAPLYLVWDNLRDPALQAEAASDWPYQVVAIELVDFATRFPHMAPPPPAPEDVQRGFAGFRKHCMTCHTINGEGGAKSIELNYPANVTEYFREEWLRRWIEKPTALRFSTAMPQLNPGVPNRARLIDDLIAYLKFMANHKKVPTRLAASNNDDTNAVTNADSR